MPAQLNDDAWHWYACYGHLNYEALRKLAQRDMVRGHPKINHINQICDSFLVGKQCRTPFPQQAKYCTENLLGLVHGDLCEPITPTTLAEKCYFLLLVDDLSHYIWLTLLATKDEATTTSKHFQADVEVESGQKLQALRTDHGNEFTFAEFGEYYANQGIKRLLMVPYSLQQNGVVERRNQTVITMARIMLKAKDIPGEF